MTGVPVESGAPAPPEELLRAMQEFSEIRTSLVSSYEALERRAERVEAELATANAELESKVDQLDGLSRHLEALLRALPTGVVERDAHGRVVRANQSATEILRTDEDTLLGALEHPGLSGDSADDLPHERVLIDGSTRVIASRHAQVRDEDGAIRGSVEILDDRTELDALTRRVHAMDKMAALGTMAGGIAHELKNPLNAIQGFARLLCGRLEGDGSEPRWAALIERGAREIDQIVTSMLTLARPEPLVLETLDPNELAADALRTAFGEDETPAGLDVTTRVELGPFAGDRIKLRQALRNLVANAWTVLPDGGSIEVALTSSDGFAHLTVSDSGPGIPAELASRVTDPFFTTRAEGTGLGLALVSTIARLHGGELEVDPDPSPLGGARVSISIPLEPVPQRP